MEVELTAFGSPKSVVSQAEAEYEWEFVSEEQYIEFFNFIDTEENLDEEQLIDKYNEVFGVVETSSEESNDNDEEVDDEEKKLKSKIFLKYVDETWGGDEEIVIFTLAEKYFADNDEKASVVCELVKHLVTDGFPVNYRREMDHWSLLHTATKRINWRMIYALIEADADIELQIIDNKSGVTALSLAASCGFLEGVDTLIAQGAEVNVVEADTGATPLHKAAESGSLECMQSLYSYNAIDIKTLEGKTPRDLYVKAANQDEKEQWENWLEKIWDKNFNEQMFLEAINCAPELGKIILDEFIIHHSLLLDAVAFRELHKIYGSKHVEKSALHAIVNLKTQDRVIQSACKQYCLQNIVMKRVLELKWEFFAQRLYLEQLLMYVLFLISSTMSATLMKFSNEPVPPFYGAFAFWTIASMFVSFSFIFAQFLKPKSLLKIAHWIHLFGENVLREDKYFRLDEYKPKAKMLLLRLSVLFSIIASTVLLLIVGHRSDLDFFTIFMQVNNVLLWILTIYFLFWELKEMRGSGVRAYFRSFVNIWQLVVYALIIFVYVPEELGLYSFESLQYFQGNAGSFKNVRLSIAGFMVVSLWMNFLQYLEVHPTAGYLLPMMSGLMADIYRFLIFYGVFQCGMTCAYYILFRGEDGYTSLIDSFITVYWILFGQVTLDPFYAKTGLLYVLSMGLIMFHLAGVVLLLLNVLIAMMTQTMEHVLESAKEEALGSYAGCILRLENSLSEKEREEMIYVAAEKPAYEQSYQSEQKSERISVTSIAKSGTAVSSVKSGQPLSARSNQSNQSGQTFSPYSNTDNVGAEAEEEVVQVSIVESNAPLHDEYNDESNEEDLSTKEGFELNPVFEENEFIFKSNYDDVFEGPEDELLTTFKEETMQELEEVKGQVEKILENQSELIESFENEYHSKHIRRREIWKEDLRSEMQNVIADLKEEHKQQLQLQDSHQAQLSGIQANMTEMMSLLRRLQR